MNKSSQPQPPKAMTQLPSANRVIASAPQVALVMDASRMKLAQAEAMNRMRQAARNSLGVNNAPSVDRILD